MFSQPEYDARGAGSGAVADGLDKGVVNDEQGAVLPGVTITPSAGREPRPRKGRGGVYRFRALEVSPTCHAELSGLPRPERGARDLPGKELAGLC